MLKASGKEITNMDYRKEIDRINEIEGEQECFDSIMRMLQNLEDESDVAELQRLEGIYVPWHWKTIHDKHKRNIGRYQRYDFEKMEISDFFTEEHRKAMREELVPLLEELGGLWEGDYEYAEEKERMCL